MAARDVHPRIQDHRPSGRALHLVVRPLHRLPLSSDGTRAECFHAPCAGQESLRTPAGILPQKVAGNPMRYGTGVLEPAAGVHLRNGPGAQNEN